MEPDSFMISKWGNNVKNVKVPLERLGPLRAFERLCIIVLRLLEEYKTKLETNQLLPEVDQAPQKPNMMSLDALKLGDRLEIRNKIMKDVEKEFVTIKQDLAKRGYVPQTNPIYPPDNVNNKEPYEKTRPGSRSIQNLTMFSRSESGNNHLPQKASAKSPPWSIPFQLNKPAFPDLDLQAKAKYVDRDPRHQIKYFSIDESSSLLSQDLTNLNFNRNQDQPPPSSAGIHRRQQFQKNAQRMLDSGHNDRHHTSRPRNEPFQEPKATAEQVREEIYRSIVRADEERLKSNPMKIKKIDHLFSSALKP